MWLEHDDAIYNLLLIERITLSKDKLSIILWCKDSEDNDKYELDFDNEDIAEQTFQELRDSLAIRTRKL